MGLPLRLGPLAERQFRLLYAGQAVSMLGDGLVPVALAFAVLDLTGSATDLGFVFAAQTVPLVAFLLAGGVWADRLPRQLVMVASDVVRGAAQAVLATLLLTDRAELWHLLVLAAVYGSAEAFFRPAATGLLPSTVSPGRLQQANALLGMTSSGAFVAGPALAGLLVALAGPGVAIAVDAGTFAVSAYFLLLLRPPRAERPAEHRNFLAELAGGWHEFRSRTWLWVVVAASTLYLFAVVAPIQVLGPLVAKQELGGAAAWSLIMTGFGIGMVTGGAVALRWKPARPLLVASLTTLLAVPPPALLALAAPVAVIVVAQVLTGSAMGLFTALWETTLQQQIPPEKLSRVSSYDWMGSIAFMPLGFAIAGPVADAMGVDATLWCASAIVVVVVAMMLMARDVRELRRDERLELAVSPA